MSIVSTPIYMYLCQESKASQPTTTLPAPCKSAWQHWHTHLKLGFIEVLCIDLSKDVVDPPRLDNKRAKQESESNGRYPKGGLYTVGSYIGLDTQHSFTIIYNYNRISEGSKTESQCKNCKHAGFNKFQHQRKLQYNTPLYNTCLLRHVVQWNLSKRITVSGIHSSKSASLSGPK